jgi:predicted esterase
VRIPVPVLAGENDPRCPIGRIESYVDALAAAGVRPQVYRFDAGHRSLVADELIRQAIVEVGFARAAVHSRRPAASVT